MARVTVEDCLANVKNRFELVLLASLRARQIAKGADPLVPVENDKPTVLALREIADGLVKPSLLEGTNAVANTEAPTEAEIAAIEEISGATTVAETVSEGQGTDTEEN